MIGFKFEKNSYNLIIFFSHGFCYKISNLQFIGCYSQTKSSNSSLRIYVPLYFFQQTHKSGAQS